MEKHQACLAVLTNKEIVEVNQDPLGAAPQLLFQTPSATSTTKDITAQGFSRKLHDGSVAVVLLNRSPETINTLSVKYSEIGLPPTAECKIRDIIAKKDAGTEVGATTPTTIPSHGVQMLRISC